jgi:hypothetical protein
MGGGPGVKSAGLTFWVIGITIYNMWNGTSTTLDQLFIFIRTYRLVARFGGALLYLAGPFFFIFEIRFSKPHWAFACCHVEAHDWATWQPTIGLV